jgi:hypothetical protein
MTLNTRKRYITDGFNLIHKSQNITLAKVSISQGAHTLTDSTGRVYTVPNGVADEYLKEGQDFETANARPEWQTVTNDELATLKGQDVKSVQISGLRWFDKTYGNTYHSVRVWFNGVEVAYMPFAYGYDSQYVQTAGEMLEKMGLIDLTDPTRPQYKRALWAQVRDVLKVEWLDSVRDVQRKRDL